jgi:hypothetical protein
MIRIQLIIQVGLGRLAHFSISQIEFIELIEATEIGGQDMSRVMQSLLQVDPVPHENQLALTQAGSGLPESERD